MEEILKKIIEIDNKAKVISANEKERKAKIDECIESEFNTEKILLNMQYKDEIEKQKKKYDDLLEEKKKEIDDKNNIKIMQIHNNFKNNAKKIVTQIISSIKKGESNV